MKIRAFECNHDGNSFYIAVSEGLSQSYEYVEWNEMWVTKNAR